LRPAHGRGRGAGRGDCVPGGGGLHRHWPCRDFSHPEHHCVRRLGRHDDRSTPAGCRHVYHDHRRRKDASLHPCRRARIRSDRGTHRRPWNRHVDHLDRVEWSRSLRRGRHGHPPCRQRLQQRGGRVRRRRLPGLWRRGRDRWRQARSGRLRLPLEQCLGPKHDVRRRALAIRDVDRYGDPFALPGQ